MGIPFYFASLIRNHAGIVRRTDAFDVDILGIDFNCLIHHYFKREDPIESVLEGLQKVTELCRAKKVFIAFDGLVPYAKIVQQRYRRFKISEENKHQISPDTPYMRSLEQAVRERFPDISPTQEPGEGEHKIFQYVKRFEPGQVCIYGLDADLILLSLFNKSLTTELNLLRETDDGFSLMDIHKLSLQLPMEIDQYLALSVLCFGNDFMPNLGMFSLREDGYARALEYYNKSGKPDMTTEEGRAIFLDYAASKEIGVLKERIKFRKQPFERAVIGRQANDISVKYGLHILDGVIKMEPVVDAFWKTFHWTMHYFQKNDVLNWDWYYPYAEAPLLQDIVQYYETGLEKKELTYTLSQHLQIILPAASLRIAKRRVQFVDEFYSETREPWMKKYDWEVKPRISLPWPTLTSVSRF